MAERLRRLVPVFAAYGVLLVLCSLGYVLDGAASQASAYWFIFFLAPFSAVYCIPFGMGVGILAQRLVWYTASYGHRVVAAGTATVLVAMLLGWGGQLFANFDIVYLAAVIWPTLASCISMLIGMYFVRTKEYEEVSSYEEDEAYEDEYEDDAEYEDEPEAYAADSNAYAKPDARAESEAYDDPDSLADTGTLFAVPDTGHDGDQSFEDVFIDVTE